MGAGGDADIDHFLEVALGERASYFCMQKLGLSAGSLGVFPGPGSVSKLNSN